MLVREPDAPPDPDPTPSGHPLDLDHDFSIPHSIEIETDPLPEALTGPSEHEAGSKLIPSLASAKLIQRMALYQLVYSMSGLMVGLVCMSFGTAMFFHGVYGSTSWVARVLGFDSTLSDAPPGAVLFVAGLLVIFVTRFKVKVRHQRR